VAPEDFLDLEPRSQPNQGIRFDALKDGGKQGI